MLRRLPSPALRPFVSLLWASDGVAQAGAAVARRERVLPTGMMHLVFRLSDDPLRLYDTPDAAMSRAVGHAIVGGARSSFYVRDISAPSRSVGAMLHPGAARLLFGVSAAELAGQHTSVEDLWGRSAADARERLLETADPAMCLDRFEALLLARLPRVRGLHPAVAEALGKFDCHSPEATEVRGDLGIRAIVADSGYSHRRFIALFEEAVGLTPKRYGRVVRFRRILAQWASAPRIALVELAHAYGFSDQAHFNREFREMTGLSPTGYRVVAPREPHHVPIV